MAERVGFEPTERFPVHSISSAASSTTPAPLLDTIPSTDLKFVTLLATMNIDTASPASPRIAYRCESRHVGTHPRVFGLVKLYSQHKRERQNRLSLLLINITSCLGKCFNVDKKLEAACLLYTEEPTNIQRRAIGNWSSQCNSPGRHAAVEPAAVRL